jgi:hypothetical protein
VLDLKVLTHIDLDSLRHNVWRRVVNGQYFGGARDPGAKSTDIFQIIADSYQDYVDKSLAKGNETRENVLEHVTALELSQDKMPSLDEIKSNHRKLAFKHHPDRNPGDAEAGKRFDRIQKAYDKLSETHAHAEQAVKSQETIISRHLAEHQVHLGLKDVRIGTDKSFVTMPVDHMPADQKSALLKAINDHGFSVEERFSNEIGCNVVNVTRKDFGPLNCAELCQKLKSGVDNKKPAVEAVNTSKATIAETVKDAVKDAVKAGDEIAPKANGKAKWIIGGIIVATVAAGAFYAIKKKSLVQQENERRKNNEAHVQGIH